MTDHLSIFAATAIALYAGHHVGDYWVQRDDDAQHKGDAGFSGSLHCLLHVLTYVATQAFCAAPLALLGASTRWWQIILALALSGVTHYTADRREHGLMFKLARLLPGKARFLELGAPRFIFVPDADRPEVCVRVDQPTLGTGAWALDQAWHIFFGVFLAALVIAL